MIEDAIRAVIADPYIPRHLAELLVGRLLNAWNIDSQSSEARGLRAPISHRLAEFLFTHADWKNDEAVLVAGPTVSGLPDQVRVTQVTNWNSLSRMLSSDGTDYLANQGITLDHAPYMLQPLYDEDWIGHALSSLPSKFIDIGMVGRRPVSWVTLINEISDASSDEIVDNLGLVHLPFGTPIVAISYTVRACDLHVPTMIDANFYPGFIPKPPSLSGPPRAWSWRCQTWGYSEMVHRRGTAVGDVRVRHLGVTRVDPTLLRPYVNPYGLTGFSIPVSDALEGIVAQTLRQAFAHHQLEPFIAGDTDLLSVEHREFERFVELLYRRDGYETRLTKQSRDGGIDIIAVSDSPKQDGFIIQAKHVRGTVGIQVVRELIGARFLADEPLNSYMMVIVTTGRFSKVAEIAQNVHSDIIKLRDYNDLHDHLSSLRNVGKTDIVQMAIDKSRLIHWR